VYERLEFQANPSLGFPGSDTDRLEFFEEHGELRARLRINLVGLFGAGSPLPAFYSEQALGDGPDGNTTRDFLDLFNDRLQRLLLPIWRKYRYYAHYESGARDLFSARLFALIGLGGERLRAAEDLNWRRLLPYLGLLSLRAHSAALVESVLRYYFKHADLRIEQCVERRVEIIAEQRNRLGLANSQLGESLVLGDSVRDRGGKFRIHIRQLSWARFHEFLPIGNGYQPSARWCASPCATRSTTTSAWPCATRKSASCASARTTSATSAGPPGSATNRPMVWSPSAARLIKGLMK